MQLHEAEGILCSENKEAWKGELLEHRFYIHALWAQGTLAIEAGRRARRWSEILDGKQRTWERDLARLADFPEEYEGWGLSRQDNGGVLVSCVGVGFDCPLTCSLRTRMGSPTSKNITA